MKRYKAATEALKLAEAQKNKAAMEEATARAETRSDLFQRDMGAFLRLYTFLSQIFDYGNTAIEKRAIFYKQAAAAAGVWPRARRHRPVQGRADAP